LFDPSFSLVKIHRQRMGGCEVTHTGCGYRAGGTVESGRCGAEEGWLTTGGVHTADYQSR